jgi:hypothetical protein
MGNHRWAGALGVVAFILAALGVGEFYGYITVGILGGVTSSALFLLAFLAVAGAVGVYYLED